ncbi:MULTISPECIES: PAS domain-containing protein [Bacillus]|uniref:histidine kinase n=4 Tax=Bacillus TaxID=1386 RepID=A0A0M5JE46_9BACI|nr:MULTISPECIES: PAS domain-containing protein [Bacillus]ALC80877.1 sporulation kinase [Bacillus gobiensis]MBP1079817.1 two-component system sporulation sensor kinase A [Bacillus capparidis]MED1095206.1 PAS domain-containing protein [Bacillus capparidis]
MEREDKSLPHKDLYAVLSATGQIKYISSNCSALLGYRQEELIGTLMKNYLHKEDQFLIDRFFYNEHRLMPCTFRFIMNDYSHVHIEAAIDFITNEISMNEREIILKMRTINQPVDIESQNEPDIQNASWSSEEASKLFNNLPGALYISIRGKIVYANKSMLQLLGASHFYQIIGKYAYEFIEEDYHEIVKNRIIRMQKGLDVGIVEQTWRKLDGSLIHLEVNSAATVFEKQNAEVIQLIDVSFRKKFQDILQKSRERYQLLIQNSIDTIAVIHNEKWVFINNSGIQLFDAEDYDQLIGKDIYSLLHPNDHQDVKNRLERFIENKTDSEIMKQTWYTFKERLIYTEMVCIPTTFFGHNAVQIILRDISERKQTEELMLRSEKLSLAGQLAAGIAHEIRNPLTAIKGFLQLMKPAIHKNGQYFDIVFSELNRIELILSELLMLAKPQQHAINNSLNMNKLIREVTALLDTQANLNGIIINPSYCNDEDSTIKGDGNHLKQVFINFIKNSIESMPAGGKIDIAIQAEKDYIEIVIKDEGEGIPEDILKRIGEPFLTTKEKGTGLGLMISYKIIEDHQGTVKVKSKIGEGTTFTIRFIK